MINRCCDCGRLFRGPASIGAICEACDLAREIEADETERINAARISNMRAMQNLASKLNPPAAHPLTREELDAKIPALQREARELHDAIQPAARGEEVGNE